MEMASSSSSPPFDIPRQEKYDVFLSFRGEDTRNTFTSHLHAALRAKKIKTFIDYKLEKGDKIGPTLLEAIDKSKLWVIIFSENYASSTWCLDELAHILECKERRHIVMPIFYGINPADVRKQQGSYADSFAQLEQRFKHEKDKVDKWRAALEEATAISGFHYSNKTRTEADFVGKVVEAILGKLSHKSSCDLKGLVGIERKIEQIESLLCITSLDVRTVCIWGMGGIGKTTLADAVYHHLSSKFEGCCFLANVREQAETEVGVLHLRNKLIRKILNDENINIDTPSVGSAFVLERLLRTKALIVLDDVNHSSQLKLLAGDDVRFGPGSRIIITTRDRSLLEEKIDNDKIYKVEGLSSDEALQLFHLHAFKNKPLTKDYTELSRMVVDYVKGIPLALKILGPLFLRHKRKEEWEEELNKLKKFPSGKIQNVLRLSYNGLEENEKEIFLDVACFFKGMKIDSAKRMLKARGFFAGGIQVLVDKSLISISTSNCLDMHDLLLEVGLAIVREQCIEEPGKRSRLYTTGDVYHVLENNTGTATVQCISFPLSEIRDPQMSVAGLKKMYNLRYLSIWERSPSYYQNFGDEKLHLSQGLESLYYLSYLRWEFYPLKSLPSKFSPRNLVELRLPFSEVESPLWNEDQAQNLRNLKVIDLSDCVHLTEVPNLSQSPNIERINFNGCTRVVRIPSYFQYLDKLTHLDLGRCKSLRYIPDMPGNIEFLSLGGSGIEEIPSSVWSHGKMSSLDIRDCEDLEYLPSGSCKLKVSGTLSLKGCKSFRMFSELPRDITVLDLSWTAIKGLPSSIECLINLTTITLKDCKRLVTLPTSIWKLKLLEVLDLTRCSEFKYFPEILEPVDHLQFLSFEKTAVEKLPISIGNLIGLTAIKLNNCKRLVSLPTSICKLKSLDRLDLTDCSEFQYFPEIMEPMEHLKFLSLEQTAVRELPFSIGNLFGLTTIKLNNCKRLVSLPMSICKLKSLNRLDLTSCSNFQYFPEIMEPMEHLEFLSLEETVVKELPSSLGNLIGLQNLKLNLCKSLEFVPSSIYKLNCLKTLSFYACSGLKQLPSGSVGLVSLEVLNLSCSGILEIPDGLICLSSLRDLDLRYTQIKSIPAIIKQASQLSHLCLCNLFQCELSPFDCPRLKRSARINIMEDAQLTIRLATGHEDEVNYVKPYRSLATFVCPGYNIPNCFSYQNEGSSINIKLPPDWFRTDFLGFAISLLSVDQYINKQGLNLDCKFIFKTNSGESHEINCPYIAPGVGWQWWNHSDEDASDSHLVVVLYNAFELEEGDNSKCSSAFYNLVTEVFVQLYHRENSSRPLGDPTRTLEKCGISLLYARDANKIRFNVPCLK